MQSLNFLKYAKWRQEHRCVLYEQQLSLHWEAERIKSFLQNILLWRQEGHNADLDILLSGVSPALVSSPPLYHDHCLHAQVSSRSEWIISQLQLITSAGNFLSLQSLNASCRAEARFANWERLQKLHFLNRLCLTKSFLGVSGEWCELNFLSDDDNEDGETEMLSLHWWGNLELKSVSSNITLRSLFQINIIVSSGFRQLSMLELVISEIIE